MDNNGTQPEYLILIVEDDEALREGLRIDLEEYGYKVVSAENGLEALNILVNGENVIDLILSDEKMPVMGGYELCQAVNNDPNLQEIPFVYLTASASEKEFLKGFELGAIDYIVKPYNYGKLLVVIKKRIENSEIIRKSQMEIIEKERLQQVADMAQAVSHDIRGVLNDLGFSVLVQKEIGGIQESLKSNESGLPVVLEGLTKIDEYCVGMGRAVELGVDLLEDLQSFSHGEIEEKSLFLVGAIVEIPLKILHRNFINLGVEVDCDFDQVLMECRKQDVMQIALNLIRNAVHAMENSEKKKLSLRLWEEGERVFLSVTDTGTGIPLDVQDKVFRWDFTTKKEGSGVGLASIKRLVGSYRGTIRFETKINEGTKFIVTFPSYKEIENPVTCGDNFEQNNCRTNCSK